MKTTLRRIGEIDPTDFGVDLLEYQMLTRASDRGEEVTVLDMASQGDNAERSYYNVQLSNGLKVEALAGYHLNNINEFWGNTTELLHCQLVVDIQYVHSGDYKIDHSALEDMICDAVNVGIKACPDITEMKLHDVEVQFETEFTTTV